MTEQEKTIAWYVLAYLGIFALIPLLVEEKDEDVQWHAKHGLVLFGAELVALIALLIFTTLLNIILPSVMWVFSCLIWTLVWFAVLALHVVCILKALRGERLKIGRASCRERV